MKYYNADICCSNNVAAAEENRKNNSNHPSAAHFHCVKTKVGCASILVMKNSTVNMLGAMAPFVSVQLGQGRACYAKKR